MLPRPPARKLTPTLGPSGLTLQPFGPRLSLFINFQTSPWAKILAPVLWYIDNYTRGVQKVRRPTQLTTRYARHIMSLFNIFSCNWNALGPGFLQSSHSVVEELLFLVFQSAICRADNVLVVRNFVFFHEFFQFRKKIEVTWIQDNAPNQTSSNHTLAQALAAIQNAGFELLHCITHRFHHSYLYLLAGRPRTYVGPGAFLLQENMLKSDKYDLRIS